MAIDPSQVQRFAHGSRVPGWDEAADLTKDPAVVPDPATTPVPEDAARARSRRDMAKYPDFRSAAIPALHVVQREHGWCSPTAIEQAACVMRLTPGYLTAVATFYDMFATVPAGEHQSTCARTSRARCAAPTRSTRRCCDAAGDDPRFNVRAFECLGACDIAPMASVDGEYVGPLTEDDCRTIVDDVLAGREPLLEAKQLARARRPRRLEHARAEAPLQGHRRAGPQHARGLRAPRRLRDAAQGAEDGARRRCSTRCSPPTCAAAAAPASRWARRCPSSPRGRWTSTSSATPTSPSRARSRTAS